MSSWERFHVAQKITLNAMQNSGKRSNKTFLYTAKPYKKSRRKKSDQWPFPSFFLPNVVIFLFIMYTDLAFLTRVRQKKVSINHSRYTRYVKFYHIKWNGSPLFMLEGTRSREKKDRCCFPQITKSLRETKKKISNHSSEQANLRATLIFVTFPS